MPVSIDSRSCPPANHLALANKFDIKIEYCCPSMEILVLHIFPTEEIDRFMIYVGEQLDQNVTKQERPEGHSSEAT